MMKNLRRFGVGSMLALALLVAPFTGKAQTVDGLKQRAREAKVSSDLLTVICNGIIYL
jgi:hypothetical protein